MTAIAQALSAALIEFVWQGLLAAFLLWSALVALRNRPARTRYLAGCVALAAMAIAPVVTACILYTPIAQPVGAWSTAAPQAVQTVILSHAGTAFDRTGWLSRWALPLWSLGVLFFSLRLVWAARQISAQRRQAQPAESTVLAMVNSVQQRLRMARPVRLLISASADGPSVAGWIKPVVLLPAASIAGLTPQQLEAVLAHELAHILRHDYLINMLQSIIETLLFYHPAVWWVSGRIRHERELCCDDLAVESCGDALCYARALTRLERLRTATPALALGGAGGSLLYRIQRLAGETGNLQGGPSKLPGILALSLGLACFGLNMQWARGQQQDAARPAAADTPAATEPDVHIDLGGAVLNHREEVEYPGPALEKGIQGTVVVEATLDGSGAVSDARVLSGPQELRKAALQSVLEWHFAPDTAGPAQQVRIDFLLSPGGAAKTRTDESARKAEARAMIAGKRQQELAGLLEQKMMAENLERQARNLQLRKVASPEADADAKRLVDETTMLQLKRNLQAAELAELAAVNQGAQGTRPAEQKVQAEAIERKIEALRSQAANLAENNSELSEARNSQMAILKKKMAELKMEFADFPAPSFAGHTLKSIDAEGLSPAAREELLARLPVHAGDTLSEESIGKIEAVVKQFDQHLGISMFSRDGQVELRISVTSSHDSQR